jgi:hypothetical protein
VAFEVASYDRSRPLIIDPVLVYSTYLGGSDLDYGSAIAVDASGNAYVTGSTFSTDFPTTSGAFKTSLRGSMNAFVTKLNAAGSALVYSTYLGGSGTMCAEPPFCVESGSGIAADASGNAYVAGRTSSPDFPTTPEAFQKSFGGGLGHAFVTKLNATGSALIYSSYLGGGSSDEASDIAVDGLGSGYVTGITGSSDFPVTSGAFQTSSASAWGTPS